MPPQTVTFPCPFCGRRMGVPADLLGKQVRCPHCKQVVLAPVGAAPSGVVPAVPLPPPPPPPLLPPSPPVLPAPVVVAPPPPPPSLPSSSESELPTFTMQRKEGADSILGDPDESEDEVFGSQIGARLGTVPPLDLTGPTAPTSPDGRPPAGDGPFEATGTTASTEPTAPAPQPVPTSAPTQGTTSQQPDPFLDLEPVTLPAVCGGEPSGSKPAAPV
ncbi:MAG: hypothetical protein J0I06_26845, partial [Planctomycetes bacterium]|nr:hypothetical protein [Planctomycetota bacterium]